MRLIRLPEVMKMTSLPKSTLWGEISEENFPKPAQLSARSRAWLESEVIAWIESKIALRDKQILEEEK